MAENITKTRDESEKSGKSTGAKVAMTLAAAAIVVVYAYAEKIAAALMPEPDAPAKISKPTEPIKPVLREPAKPERKKVERPNIEIAIGVDITRSKIRRQLPEIKDALLDFFRTYKNTLIKNGDTIDICTFAEKARCFRFDMPEGFDELMKSIRDIQVVQQGDYHETHVAVSIGDMLDFLNDTERSILTLWTDAIDEGETPDRKITKPVKLMIPDQGYFKNAEAVKRAMEGVPACDTNCESIDILLAKTGTDFAKLLKEFADQLQQKAQELADGEAKAKYDLDIADFDREKEELERKEAEFKRLVAEWKAASEKIDADYKAALDKYKGDKEALQKRIQKTKKIIEVSLMVLGILLALLSAFILWLESRPKFKGLIVDSRENPARRLSLPRGSGQRKHRLRLKDGESLHLEAGKDGVTLLEHVTKSDTKKVSKFIPDRGELIPGVRYFIKPPKTSEQGEKAENTSGIQENPEVTPGSGSASPQGEKDEYGWKI